MNEPWYQEYYDATERRNKQRFNLKSVKMLEKYLAVNTNKHPTQFECHMAGKKMVVLYFSTNFPNGLCRRYVVTKDYNGDTLYMYDEKDFEHIVRKVLLDT